MTPPAAPSMPVPGMGAEDVVVDADGLRLDRHRGRQRSSGSRPTVGASTGSATPAAARSGSSSTPTAGCWSATPAAGLLAHDTATGVVERLTTRGRRRSGWCSATTPRSPATATSGSPTPVTRLPHRRGGRPTSSRTPAPAGCCAGAPDGTVEVRARRAARSPTGSRWPRTSPTSRSPRPARRTVVRHWLTGDARRAARPARQRPARLPRQHRPRQRRADLGHHRLARDPVVERLQTGADAGAPAGHPDPATAPAEAEADRPGAGLRRRTARSCTTSTRTRGGTTWSPACGSTTAGSGWAACTSLRSRSSASGRRRLDFCIDRRHQYTTIREHAPDGSLEHITVRGTCAGSTTASSTSWPPRSATCWSAPAHRAAATSAPTSASSS